MSLVRWLVKWEFFFSYFIYRDDLCDSNTFLIVAISYLALCFTAPETYDGSAPNIHFTLGCLAGEWIPISRSILEKYLRIKTRAVQRSSVRKYVHIPRAQFRRICEWAALLCVGKLLMSGPRRDFYKVWNICIFFYPYPTKLGRYNMLHHVVIKIRQLFVRLATYLTSTLKLEWAQMTAHAAGTNGSTCIS
jgi:hypothetical protein